MASSRRLTGAPAVALSVLLNAPQHTSSLEELAFRFWPEDRPAHWKRLLQMNFDWLRRTLPSGWSLANNDTDIKLVLEEGTLEDFTLIDGVLTNTTCAAPSPENLHSLDPTLPSDALACAAHRTARTSLPSLATATGVSYITHQAGQPAPDPNAWRDVLASEGHPRGSTFLAGTTPDVAFGDTAAAFAAARRDLLDLKGNTPHARAAMAWRVLRDHLPVSDDKDSPTRSIVIFDAHNMDDGSLELARLTVRFPLADNVRILCVGDSTHPRPAWQQLLRDFAEADCPHFMLCPECDPSLLTGDRIDHRSALCG